MVKIKFKVGDRVRAKETADSQVRGHVGKILRVHGDKIGVQYDDYLGSHDLDGLGKDGHCWNSPSLDLEKVSMYAPNFAVVWETEDNDPIRFFGTEKEAREFIRELSEKRDLLKDSVRFLELKSVSKVSLSTTLKMSKITKM